LTMMGERDCQTANSFIEMMLSLRALFVCQSCTNNRVLDVGFHSILEVGFHAVLEILVTTATSRRTPLPGPAAGFTFLTTTQGKYVTFLTRTILAF